MANFSLNTSHSAAPAQARRNAFAVPAALYLNRNPAPAPHSLSPIAHSNICAARAKLLEMCAADVGDSRACHRANLTHVVMKLRGARAAGAGPIARAEILLVITALCDVQEWIDRKNLNAALDQFLIAEMRLAAILLADFETRIG